MLKEFFFRSILVIYESFVENLQCREREREIKSVRGEGEGGWRERERKRERERGQNQMSTIVQRVD
jgi:hypothetical protein